MVSVSTDHPTTTRTAVAVQVGNPLGGQSYLHSVNATLYTYINLHPSIRMTIPAIQVATIAMDVDVKAVGMVEILTGGTTSFGAQVRAPRARRARNPGACCLLALPGQDPQWPKP